VILQPLVKILKGFLIDRAHRLWYGKPKSKPENLDGRVELSDSERINMLREFVIRQVANGASIELQENFSAVLIWGRKANHILHLLLSLVTFGLWIIVWILIAINSGEKRRLYQIDKYGRICS
jgi:hypothetical protein